MCEICCFLTHKIMMFRLHNKYKFCYSWAALIFLTYLKSFRLSGFPIKLSPGIACLGHGFVTRRQGQSLSLATQHCHHRILLVWRRRNLLWTSKTLSWEGRDEWQLGRIVWNNHCENTVAPCWGTASLEIVSIDLWSRGSCSYSTHSSHCYRTLRFWNTEWYNCGHDKKFRIAEVVKTEVALMFWKLLWLKKKLIIVYLDIIYRWSVLCFGSCKGR